VGETNLGKIKLPKSPSKAVSNLKKVGEIAWCHSEWEGKRGGKRKDWRGRGMEGGRQVLRKWEAEGGAMGGGMAVGCFVAGRRGNGGG